MSRNAGCWAAVAAGLLLASSLPSAEQPRWFVISVVDEQTGRGVPLVELRTVHGIRLWTDSAGTAVFDEPGLMGRDVYFHVRSHGYAHAADGFGNRGKALKAVRGGRARLVVRRVNIAERLYRLTGAGIYRDTLLAGGKAPTREPLLNAQVLGSDSVLTAAYRGKLYWFWGDTSRPGYPLGNFDTPGATSPLPGRPGALDPDVGVNLDYFKGKDGFARPTLKMPGKGPTWMVSLLTLPDPPGKERLYASYVKVRPPLAVYARGLAAYDDEKNEFTHLQNWDLDAPAFPEGHAFRHGEYAYFANPYPLTRVRATAQDFRRPGQYETYTCLREGSRPGRPRFDRDAAGRLRYGWKKATPPADPEAQARWLAAGKLKPAEALLPLGDRDTGKPVLAQRGSVYWNAYRKRWVLIAVQKGGTSFLGEVWYAEGDTPLGPWVYAVKVATHDRYSFYNPRHHPLFDKHGGRVIYFEGTYSNTFSGNPDATPRYDYNQLLYKLDLADPRLRLPAPVYELPGTKSAAPFAFFPEAKKPRLPVRFFAMDRPAKGLVPVFAPAGADPAAGPRVGGPLKDDVAPPGRVLFYALPAGREDPPATTAALYEYTHARSGRRFCSTNAGLKDPGYERSARPLCRVWASPWGEGAPRP
jgi:hypothetical protein